MATSEQIAELFEKLEIERSAMLVTLEGMSDEQAEHRPPEGEGEAGWSVKEQVVHLAGMDRSYRGWVRRAIAEDSPNVSDGRTPNIPLDIPFEQAHDADLASLVAQMQGEREETLELARTFTPEQFDRTARTQIFGELTVLQWLRSYYRHDRMHHAQMLGEVSDYEPQYAPGQQEPPLQRD
ncbi:MAG: DinB family protein [Chloroflexi bacterium]|nr:DinB family protein [Chloroflexota bacterium]